MDCSDYGQKSQEKLFPAVRRTKYRISSRRTVSLNSIQRTFTTMSKTAQGNKKAKFLPCCVTAAILAFFFAFFALLRPQARGIRACGFLSQENTENIKNHPPRKAIAVAIGPGPIGRWGPGRNFPNLFFSRKAEGRTRRNAFGGLGHRYGPIRYRATLAKESRGVAGGTGMCFQPPAASFGKKSEYRSQR